MDGLTQLINVMYIDSQINNYANIIMHIHGNKLNDTYY